MKSPGPRAFSDTGGLSPAGRRRRRQCRGRHQWPATPWEVREFSYLWSRSALDPTRGPDKEAGGISPPAPLIARRPLNNRRASTEYRPELGK
jgi:hypothetical protein